MPITHTTWAKGQSGNPGGRPRIVEAHHRVLRAKSARGCASLKVACQGPRKPYEALIFWG